MISKINNETSDKESEIIKKFFFNDFIKINNIGSPDIDNFKVYIKDNLVIDKTRLLLVIDITSYFYYCFPKSW